MSSTDQLNAALAGRYEVEREVGAGGMATVYLARDVKHQRRVAVKVLHPDLAAALGAERFLAEIRTTANLQHPHILPLHDSGEVDGFLFYVMPFVEGETLRGRLERERQLPIEHAVRIATEVLGALDYAHRHGVIHRDVKPENILLHDGTALVADFGIALAVTAAAGARMTQTGLSLGTPQYMSPEQAMGEKHIDARSDVYATGAVLYEMLTGEPPFTGATVQAIVAKVMTERPMRATAVRDTIPANIEAAVERSLAKLPADRFMTAQLFAEALSNTGFTVPVRRVQPASPPAEVRRWRRIAVASGIVSVASLAVLGWNLSRPTPTRPVLRYTMAPDSGTRLIGNFFFVNFAISPDGSRLAFVGTPADPIVIRRRDDLSALPVAGTDGGFDPFFSPDGHRLGFVVRGTTGSIVKIASLDGGVPFAVSDSISGITWGEDGFLYGMGRRTPHGIVRVAAQSGATIESLTQPDSSAGERQHMFPDVHPDGKTIVFTIVYLESGKYAVAGVRMPGGKPKVIVQSGLSPRLARSGHLLWTSVDGTLMAAPFDAKSLTLTGEPVTLGDSLRRDVCCVAQHMVLSGSGTLIYPAGGSSGSTELVWTNRDGTKQRLDSTFRGPFNSWSVSPDGTRIAASKSDRMGYDIWIKPVSGGQATRITSEGRNRGPTWTPDGSRLLYRADSAGKSHVFIRPADGSGQAVRLTNWPSHVMSAMMIPGNTVLLVSDATSRTDDIFSFRPGIDSVPALLIGTTKQEYDPSGSPDGRFMAYSSTESGRAEVYVVPMPNVGASKWIVSSNGGLNPVWSRRGDEIFYVSGGNIMSARVKTTPTFSVLETKTLFPTGTTVTSIPRPWDVAPDGQRFLFSERTGPVVPEHLVVVENVFEELTRKARP